MISNESIEKFQATQASTPLSEHSQGFDMEAFLTKHRFTVIRRKPWQSHPGDVIYELAECPFDPTHRNGSAAFTLAAGQPGFRCQHNGCNGRTIKHVFAVYPPAGSRAAIVAEWPDLIPLERITPAPLPAECLPGWLGEMAHAVAQSTETPFDLAALLAIAVASSCVAGKADISPENGYVEPLNIYAAPAMESGSRKTSVFNRLLAPLIEWERLEIARIEPERNQALSQRKTLESRIEHLRRKAASASDSSALIQEVLKLERELPNVPPQPRLFSEDVTPERLASMMQDQGGKMAVFSDEGGVFDMLAGRYAKGVPNIDLWLKSHSVSALRVDRQDRTRPPIIIDRPHLTVGISPQPDVLQSLKDKPGFRGRGLLARFLYALPPSAIGYRTLELHPILPEIERRYGNGIWDLIEYRPITAMRLRLTASAYREWKDFQVGIEPDFREGGRLESLRDWGGKLAGAAARLAGLFHMIIHSANPGVEDEIQRSTVEAATRLAENLISHARAVFALMERDPFVEDARKVTSWIIRQRKGFFAARDCFRSHQGRFQRVDAMMPVLTLLEQHGYIRLVRPDSTGGRRGSEICEVNPELLQRAE